MIFKYIQEVSCFKSQCFDAPKSFVSRNKCFRKKKLSVSHYTGLEGVPLIMIVFVAYPIQIY